MNIFIALKFQTPHICFMLQFLIINRKNINILKPTSYYLLFITPLLLIDLLLLLLHISFTNILLHISFTNNADYYVRHFTFKYIPNILYRYVYVKVKHYGNAYMNAYIQGDYRNWAKIQSFLSKDKKEIENVEKLNDILISCDITFPIDAIMHLQSM